MDHRCICPFCRELGKTSRCIKVRRNRNHVFHRNQSREEFYDEKGYFHKHGILLHGDYMACSNDHYFIHVRETTPECTPCGIERNEVTYYENMGGERYVPGCMTIPDPHSENLNDIFAQQKV